jgi:hypothetical protein
MTAPQTESREQTTSARSSLSSVVSVEGEQMGGTGTGCSSNSTYYVSGSASGPYPGSFRASGTASRLGFTQRFSIISGSYVVSGTMNRATFYGPNCRFSGSAPYTATVATSSGTTLATYTGTASVNLSLEYLAVGAIGVLSETL